MPTLLQCTQDCLSSTRGVWYPYITVKYPVVWVGLLVQAAALVGAPTPARPTTSTTAAIRIRARHSVCRYTHQPCMDGALCVSLLVVVPCSGTKYMVPLHGTTSYHYVSATQRENPSCTMPATARPGVAPGGRRGFWLHPSRPLRQPLQVKLTSVNAI
jgi:hypothetical protein